MSGTLSSLNTALSALRFNRVAMDVASNNIANATTDGYVRRRVVGEAVGAPDQVAMWSRYDGVGGGVASGPMDRMADPFLDTRARREHGNQSYLDVRSGVLQRLESGIAEPGDNGVAAALADFRDAWHDLANNPGGAAARNQVLARANTLVDAVRMQASNVATEQSDQRARLQTTVVDVNTAAADLAATNQSIAAGRYDGDSSLLLDQRDRLAMRLAELTGGVAVTNADGGLDVAVNGVPLVSGRTAGRLEIATGVTPSGGADGNPVTFQVVSGATTTPVPSGLRGEAGAVADLLTTTLPAYAAGLDAVVKGLADQVNAQHALGFDLAGNPGGAFFTYDPADVAGTVDVAITDPAAVAASSLPGGVLDGTNADTLADFGGAEDGYQRLVNGFGAEVASVRRLSATQQMLTGQVDGSREQLAGVNLDEETVAMLSAQRTYEAAARVMTVMDSVLDTLINRTGMLR